MGTSVTERGRIGKDGFGRKSFAPHLGLLVLLCVARPEPLFAQFAVSEATITELQAAMTAGHTTSVEITRAYLARIEAYDEAGPGLNAILRLNPRALAEAAAADAARVSGAVRGPLHGIPVVIKDNIDVLGMPTSAGSLALAGMMPPDDATQVRRLREAGAVILGKTNMHELAAGITTRASLGGQTLNPYNLERNPGGSSGGTAVAVTASFAAVGWGTDGCGSIRVPASQNNLVGLRPTKGLSSLDGVLSLSSTHDVAGPLARSVRDLAIALDATVGPDPADPATRALLARELPGFVAALDGATLAGARIGVLGYYFSDPRSDLPAETVLAALDEMVALGATVFGVEIPGMGELIREAIVMSDEFKWDLQEYLAQNPNAPVRTLSELLALGLVSEDVVPFLEELDRSTTRVTPEYLMALAQRETLAAAVVQVMDSLDLDAIAYPTLQAIPAHLDDSQAGSNCALSSNTGLPALSFPAGFTDSGLPMGIEFLGRPFDDARLVALAYAFEQATHHRRPPPAAPPLLDGRRPPPVVFTTDASALGLESAPGSTVNVRLRFIWDPVTSLLEYDFRTTGIEPEELYGLVLRYMNDRGQWSVLESLAAPGEMNGSGVLRADAGFRALLERGELFVDVYTRPFPFGAARARVQLPG